MRVPGISLETMSQEIEIGLGKKARMAYALDDVSIVPSRRTRDSQDVSTSWQVDAYEFDVPVIGAPMDSVTSPATAIAMGRLGALGVLDLEGLWTRYDDPQPRDASVAAFVRFHFLKLFRMMIVGFVAFTMLDAITPGSHTYHLMDIVAQMGMFNNLLPTPDRIIWPGPYWFFGLMLQLYIVYRLLLFRRHWAVTVGLMVVCTVIQMACDPESEALNRWRYNFIGGMLPFGAGLLYARYATGLLSWRDGVGHARFDTLNLMVSVVLIFLLSFNYWTWYLVPLCVCSASIACVRLVGETPWLDGIGRILVWTGSLSAALFVCHPITRKIFIPISHHGDVYAGLLLYIIASLCLAWLVALLMEKIPNPTLKKPQEA